MSHWCVIPVLDNLLQLTLSSTFCSLWLKTSLPPPLIYESRKIKQRAYLHVLKRIRPPLGAAFPGTQDGWPTGKWQRRGRCWWFHSQRSGIRRPGQLFHHHSTFLDFASEAGLCWQMSHFPECKHRLG